MKILNGKVFENGKFVEKEVATDGSFSQQIPAMERKSTQRAVM